MQISSKQKFALTIALSIITVGLTGTAFWWFDRGIIASRVRLDEIEEKILRLDEEKRAARHAALLFAKRGADIARIERFFVPREKPIEFIEGLENLARLTHNTISLGLEDGRAGNEFLSFKIMLDGTEASLLRYLSLLELFPNEIEIDEVTLQRAAGSSESSRPSPKIGERTVVPTHRLILSIKVRTHT